MRPNTRVYPFFDNIDISVYVTPDGGSSGGNVVTDANGSVTGTFAIPNPATTGNPKWRTGTRAFRLTSSSTNAMTGDVRTSAEADYIAKGMIQQVQGTVVPTREPQVQRTSVQQATTVQVAVGSRVISSSTTQIGTVNRGGDNGGRGRGDPVAQGFYIDQEDGLYVTSIDVFFS